MRYLALLGRIFLAAIFLLSVPTHFTRQSAAYAAQHGLPLAWILVPLAGLLALVGGLCVLLGYQTRVGAWLLVLFLVPVTLVMHNFWAVHEPAAAQLQRIQFLKNLAILGGALLLTYFGAGPLSLDSLLGERHLPGR